MKESAERIKYITNYLISYKQKIELLNKHGLFDAATLYELFASKISKLWFGQNFLNLNSDCSNFPYVDLISEDNQLYIQVSTTQDIPTKIKKTLTKIKDAKSEKVSNINKLYFFVLGNESINKIQDYSGANKIGNIDFIASEHVITINNIIDRLKDDLEFQKSLYDILFYESESYFNNAEKLNSMSNLSKALIDKNVENLLNNEYEIDRSNIIVDIKKDNHKFISIQGDAGIGKSALCKKLVLDEELILYARAEKFTEIIKLEDVWDLDINKTLKFLNGKKITFFIDALEFIADGKKTKMDILYQLYELANNYNNVYIVTSCRTCDKTAFIKLEANYNIFVYSITELQDLEIALVADKYPLIQRIWNLNSYTKLIKIPFYLNLIISKIKSIDNITDVNELRDYIWKNIICLKNKSAQYNTNISNISNIINSIVFTRAKEFLTGVSKTDIDNNILDILISEGVIIEAENKIRLKYDIFEDICFENYFDEKFDSCKGNFTNFFSEIESLGRCVYRRYQIWVENKLFVKNNRQKFLYSLISSSIILEPWKQQTVIGIVKSRFCNEFFTEYGDFICQNRLKEFLKTVNLFSFETKILSVESGNSYAYLNPIGTGRSELIKLLKKNNIYKDSSIKNEIIQICTDYSKQTNWELEIATISCEILKYFIKDEMDNIDNKNKDSLDKIINTYLTPIYTLAKYSKLWIKNFWQATVTQYKLKEDYFSKKILEYVLKNTTPALAKELSLELCEIAETYWIYSHEKEKDTYLMHYEFLRSKSNEYGLNQKAENYSYDFKYINQNSFFTMLVKFNYIAALNWAIKLTNYIAEKYKEKNSEDIFDIEIRIDEVGNLKNYLGNLQFWTVGTEENNINELIGDIIYLLKQETFILINHLSKSKELFEQFLKNIKKNIFENSNNIIMLTLIQSIGYRYAKQFPGYAKELGSNLSLIMFDTQKIISLFPDETTSLLRNHIIKTIGVYSIEKRYPMTKDEEQFIYSIHQYMINMQLQGDSNVRLQIENILDYLYSKIPNDTENAYLHLQIQKMDLRDAQAQKIDDKTIVLIPKITGEAQKIVNEIENNDFNLEQNTLSNILNECVYKINNNILSTNECLNNIDRLYNMMLSSINRINIERFLMLLIPYALKKEDLDTNRRIELCNIWLDGINRIFKNKTFIYDYPLTYVLFQEIEKEIDNEIFQEIKKLMLRLLINNSQQPGLIEITIILQKYLITNEKIAKSLFNTIIALSEKNSILKEDEIIIKYLINDEIFNLENFNIKNYDINILCNISNCGLSLKDSRFYKVMKSVIQEIIETLYFSKNSYNFLSKNKVSRFLNNNFSCSEDISLELSLLFSDIDYSKFNDNIYEFYEDSLLILFIFFDAYNSPSIRKCCIKNIKSIEKAILAVPNDSVRNSLLKLLFLTMGKYNSINGNSYPTKFSYSDKCFLNDLWSKYGKNYLSDMLEVIYNFHISELLPEVLISINNCFNDAQQDLKSFITNIKKSEITVNFIITKAFLDFNDEIKQDQELTDSYENILKLLININFKEAAVILDEFRIH